MVPPMFWKNEPPGEQPSTKVSLESRWRGVEVGGGRLEARLSCSLENRVPLLGEGEI